MPILSHSSGLAFDDWSSKLCYRTSNIERTLKTDIVKGYKVSFGQTTTVDHDFFISLLNTNNTPISIVFFYFEDKLPHVTGAWTHLTKRKRGYASFLYTKIIETYNGVASDLHISYCCAWPLWQSLAKKYNDNFYILHEISSRKTKIDFTQLENYAKECDKGGCCSKVQDTRFAIIF